MVIISKCVGSVSISFVHVSPAGVKGHSFTCPIRAERADVSADAMKMSLVKQRYRDISPVTLQVVGGSVSSSLHCGEVEGLSGGLVESFLVELYRCKVCQFTCGLRTSISSHLLLRHRPPTLNYLAGAGGGGGAEAGEEAGLDQLDLTGESKQSDEDEEFLLYNMLDNMSPPTCDISTEGGLQVAHTCEVTHLKHTHLTHTKSSPAES